jgi:Family of unknown function (DUF6065)
MNAAELVLEVWRLHPHGVRIVPADARLLGEAPPAALRWCGPFTFANKAGWWLYPPLDIDIVYKPVDAHRTYDRKYDIDPALQAVNRLPGYFEYRVVSDYEHEEQAVIDELLAPHHRYRTNRRELCAFGEVEMNVVSIWTGCVFKTPPGWSLQIRSPINIDFDQPFRIQEGMIETDWLRYDVWLNLKFFRHHERAVLRRNQRYPLAQLVPVRRESYAATWGLKDNVMNCKGPGRNEAVEIFDAWNDYNYKKWLKQDGQKDPATHNRERKKARS